MPLQEIREVADSIIAESKAGEGLGRFPNPAYNLKLIANLANAILENSAPPIEKRFREKEPAVVQPLCLKCQKSCKMHCWPELMKCNDFEPIAIEQELVDKATDILNEATRDKSSQVPITQQLEDGLYHGGDVYYVLKLGGEIGEPCTCIYLPMAEYKEYTKEVCDGPFPPYAYTGYKFHDIPVFGYTGTETKFCTD